MSLLHMSAGIPSLSLLMRPHVALSEARATPVAGPSVAAALSIGEMKGRCIARRRFLQPAPMEPSFTAQEKEIPVFGKWRSLRLRMLSFRRCLLAHSRRYGDLKQVLVPMIAAQENAKPAVPSNPGFSGFVQKRQSALEAPPSVASRGDLLFEIPIWALFE